MKNIKAMKALCQYLTSADLAAASGGQAVWGRRATDKT
jgi:hypothetical protein